MVGVFFLWLNLVLIGTFGIALADNPPPLPPNFPECNDFNRIRKNLDNDEVIQWKNKTANQYLNRGFIYGKIVKTATEAHPDSKGHQRFIVQIGPHYVSSNLCKSDTLELVYNKSFGAIPKTMLKAGAKVVACGDYITSNEPTQRYPTPSPACAILHWIHRSGGDDDNTTDHEDGFVMIDGKMFGARRPVTR